MADSKETRRALRRMENERYQRKLTQQVRSRARAAQKDADRAKRRGW